MAEKRGKGLGGRLDSYLLYYPFGFKVLCILGTQQQYALRLEKAIHNVLRAKMRQMESQHSHSGEWFLLNKQDIVTLYKGLMMTSPNYIIKNSSYLMVKNPWLVEANYRPVPQKKDPDMSKFALKLHKSIKEVATIQKPKTHLKRTSLEPKEIAF
jgi:hypothetical protein